MLNQQLLIERYQQNYQMAIDDGHTDMAGHIAWQWTEEELMRLFVRYKHQYEAARQEAVNKAFFG